MTTRGSAAAVLIDESMERIIRKWERDRIRAEVLADLLRGGATVFGRRVVLSWPEGLPGQMTEADALWLLDRAAGRDDG